MASWLSSFKIPAELDGLSKQVSNNLSAVKENMKEKATFGAAVVKEKATMGAAVMKEAADVGVQKATVGANAVKGAAASIKAQAQANEALVNAHNRLQRTCCDCLELSGAPRPDEDATSDHIARQLQLRWLQLIKAAEAMAAKGKGYKAQAKAEAERAEKAIVAGRALQMQHRAAVQRISELEEALRRANGGVGIETLMAEGEIGSLSTAARMSSARMEGDLIGMDDAGALPDTPVHLVGSSPPVASTPAFLHEAEFDLRIQLTSPEVMAAAEAAVGPAVGPLQVRITPAGSDRVQLVLDN